MQNTAEALKIKENYEDMLTDYVSILKGRSDKNKIKELADMRNIPIEAFEEADTFFIGEMGEMLLPNYLKELKTFGVISNTNNKPIFHNRWVFPIKTVSGKVQNLVGYSNAADERYIYGTSKYYRRRDTLYGLENMELAYKLGWAVLTEGITDTIRIRSLGIKNTFANCGTHASLQILTQLNRLRNGIIKIPDRDVAGREANKGWKVNRSITIQPFLKYKDIDEMLREDENIDWFLDYFNECVRIIESIEHNGLAMPSMEVTIT